MEHEGRWEAVWSEVRRRFDEVGLQPDGETFTAAAIVVQRIADAQTAGEAFGEDLALLRRLFGGAAGRVLESGRVELLR